MNPPNVLTCLVLNVDDIFMKKARIKNFLVSSVKPRQYTEKLKKGQKIGKVFQSLISPQIMATAQIGFLLLKTLHLSFQMGMS